MRKIELCCTNKTEALIAQKCNSVRIELCQALSLGGLTPSHATIESVANALERVEVNVLIRPREGDFLYSQEEIETMKRDIVVCKELGVSGVVIGALTPDGDVDVDTMKELIQLARPAMSVTFHRAFDHVKNPYKSLEDIIALGCDRLLTSGLQTVAIAGVELIRELVEQANKRIIIMPGGGVNPSNILELEAKSGANEFHSTARSLIDNCVNHRVLEIPMSTMSNSNDYTRFSTDERILTELINR